jgi:hypothetical protein
MADNLDDLRRRKLEQLQQQQQEQAQAQQQFDQIEVVIKQQFTPEALQRYGNIKVAHPETANQLIMIIAQLMNAGQRSTSNATSPCRSVRQQRYRQVTRASYSRMHSEPCSPRRRSVSYLRSLRRVRHVS